jgi:VIT1/CCC1 family predicted Fe2+/Mn2+ transporter
VRKENHKIQHIGWLRAAVLGANDGIVSTAGLVLGVAATQVSRGSLVVAGVAGLVVSALSFALGAALPLAVVALAPERSMAWAVAASALVALVFLGGLAAQTGGAKLLPGVVRVSFWSALAMAITYAVGSVFGTVAT